MEVVHALLLSIIHAVTQCSVFSMLLLVNYACRRKTPCCLRLYHSPSGKEPLRLPCVHQLQLGLTRLKLLSASFLDACTLALLPVVVLGKTVVRLPGRFWSCCIDLWVLWLDFSAILPALLLQDVSCWFASSSHLPQLLELPRSLQKHLDSSTVINIDVVIYSVLLITSVPLSASDGSASLVHILCLQIQHHKCHVQYQSGREGKRRKK